MTLSDKRKTYGTPWRHPGAIVAAADVHLSATLLGDVTGIVRVGEARGRW